MGSYNVLQTSVLCARCDSQVETAVECHFGYTGEMTGLRIGDRYPWATGKQPQNGGRPDGGTVHGEGYMECPRCHKDAFLRVIVCEDVILGVEPDASRSGYIP